MRLILVLAIIFVLSNVVGAAASSQQRPIAGAYPGRSVTLHRAHSPSGWNRSKDESIAPARSEPAHRRAARPEVSVTGVYGEFTIGEGSGDLEGMRVAIFSAGSGYHAIVQIAQGGAEDPEPVFVKVRVKGTSVAFSVAGQNYTGTVTAAGLRIKVENENRLLKRQPCSSYFGQ